MNYLKEYKQKELDEVAKYLISKRVSGIAFFEKTWEYVIEDGSIIEKEVTISYSNRKYAGFVSEVQDKKIKRITFHENLITLILENDVSVTGSIDIDYILFYRMFYE